jgi:ribosome modulation factor
MSKMDRSSYDRFSSREDIDLSEEPEYDEGYDARNQGKTLDDNPYPQLSHRNQVWMAGWADADMGILSDQECA